MQAYCTHAGILYSMETSVWRISLSATRELQSLTLGIRNNVTIKEPKIKSWHGCVISSAWQATLENGDTRGVKPLTSAFPSHSHRHLSLILFHFFSSILRSASSPWQNGAPLCHPFDCPLPRLRVLSCALEMPCA